ncbi:MAG: SIS domain-containing protein [Planctomycetes bacterium]|nr:SIS domain-containing protein [Planctomycetota bacterium]
MDAMRSEIREQPAALAAVRDEIGPRIRAALAEEGPSCGPRLVGCGDMHFAAEIARAWARLAGARGIEAHRSMDLRWEAATIAPLERVVVASFSGRTPRTVEAARLARRAGARVWAITGNAGSPVTEAADRAFVLPTGPRESLEMHVYAGYHANVPQTKTFTAALWADLAIAFGSAPDGEARDRALADLDAAPALLADVLPSLEAAAEEAVAGLPPIANALVLASGPWLPLARYGAAKFLEYAIPARGQCIEEVNHLEAFVSDARTLALVVAPDERSRGRADDLIAAGFGELGVRVARILPPAGLGSVATIFAVATAMALIAYGAARRLGRDVERWVGGVRTELIEGLSLRTIRGSRIRDRFEEPPLAAGG